MLIVGVMVGLIVYDSEEKKLVPTFINALAVINCDETHRLPSWTKCRVQSRTDSLLVRNTRKISRHIPLKSWIHTSIVSKLTGSPVGLIVGENVGSSPVGLIVGVNVFSVEHTKN